MSKITNILQGMNFKGKISQKNPKNKTTKPTTFLSFAFEAFKKSFSKSCEAQYSLYQFGHLKESLQ